MPPPQNPQQQPVINRPDAAPDWHWPIDSHTQTVDGAANPGRRPAQYIPPVAGARIRQTRLGQHNLSAQFAPIPLAQDLRAAVANWQADGYPGTTAVTRRLLRYWQTDEEREFPLYFAQLDAVLTHIYLHEATDRAPSCQQLDAINREQNRGIPRLAHKMATGTGKTLVMAMLIVWQTANHLADPTSPDYTPWFLCLTPGITVRQRLEQALIPDPKGADDYNRFRIVPPDLEKDIYSSARVTVANFHRLETPPDPNALTATGKRLIAGGRHPKRSTDGPPPESADELIKRLTGAPPQSRIYVFNDEGHHCHQGDPDKPTRKPTVWFAGLRKLHQAGRLLKAADLSATPIYVAQSSPRLFEWIVSEYGLLDAMEAGLTKIPMLPTQARTGDSLRDTRYRSLYEHSDAADRRKFNPNPASGNQLLKEALQALYRDYAELHQAWEARPYHPVMAVVMDSVRNANAFYRYVSENRDHTSLFQNLPDQPPVTIIVHSRIDEGVDPTNAGERANTKELAQAYRRHYPGCFAPQDSDADILRAALNTVGKAGQPGERIRCVISVQMLTEGWDATTVTHMLGYRAFGSSLLCEQVAGRTLRRVSHQTDDNGLLAPEYARIIGIPFPRYTEPDGERPCPICRHTPCQCPPPPTPEYLDIYCRPDRAKYEVRWPQLAGLERPPHDISLQIVAKAEPDSIFRFEAPSPTAEKMESIYGASREAEGDRYQSRDNLLFATAAAALQELNADDAQADADKPQNLLFCQFLEAGRQHLKDGSLTGPADTDRWNYHTDEIRRAGQWLYRNCHIPLPDQASRSRFVATPSHRNPWQSTGSLIPYRAARNPERIYENPVKSQISHAVCDSSWEVEAARALDQAPAVSRWARNSRLGWSIPYVADGEPHRYYPDFVAVCPLTDERELNVVIEVKGLERENDPIKRQWAQEYWLPAINAHPQYGEPAGKTWRYLYLQSLDECRRLPELMAQLAEGNDNPSSAILWL